MINLPTDVLTILNGPLPTVNNWIEITFDKNDPLRFATADLDIDGNFYARDLRGVSEVRRTLEAPIDRVAVTVQNVDRVLGQNVAQDPDEWRTAAARIGRHFAGDGMTAAVEVFRGVIQKPTVDDLVVRFDVVPDVLARGNFIAGRTLAPLCGFRFRDPATCGYTGSESECNHTLRSIGGCNGRDRRHRFGGFEHDYPPGQSIPGTASNSGVGGVGCVTGGMIVLTANGYSLAKRLQIGDVLIDPVAHVDAEIASIEVMDASIYKVRTRRGAEVLCSRTHKLVSALCEEGTPLFRIKPGYSVSVMSWEGDLFEDEIAGIEHVGSDKVYKLELAQGHHYCAGSHSLGLIVAHNSKSPFDL